MELVRVPTLTQDVPYAYAAVSPGGTVYAAGACPLDDAGDVVAPGDVAAQAGRVMRNLVEALRTAGCGLDDVLKSTVYVASSDRDDLVAAWDVVRAASATTTRPARCWAWRCWATRSQLVEVEAVALRRG